MNEEDIEELEEIRDSLERVAAADVPFSEDAQRALGRLDRVTSND